MAFSDYSTTPGSNTTIAGKSIAEGCPAANINDIIRQLAADGRSLSDVVAAINLSGYLPKSGGTVTDVIIQNGLGGHLYMGNNTMTNCPVWVQSASAALPASPTEGTMVFQF